MHGQKNIKLWDERLGCYSGEDTCCGYDTVGWWVGTDVSVELTASVFRAGY